MGKKSSKRKNRKHRGGAPSSKTTAGTKARSSILVITAAVFVAVALGAGIGVWKLTSGSSEGGGDSAKSASVKFPSWVYGPGTPSGSLKAYKAAIDYYDELSHIPCFCGCGQSAGHKSVRDCFIKSMNGESIVFDEHGAG